MARTKQEVRDFLDSLVGGVPQHPAPNQALSGQCVTLIKVLMDFLGVPNPYAGRGNATSVDNTLLNQGIAQAGGGWLTIVVNHDMGFIDGVHYGHIWIDLANESNYESNGQWALHTTKNTRPVTQGQQFVNLDKYISKEVVLMDKTQAFYHARGIYAIEWDDATLAKTGYIGMPYIEGTEFMLNYANEHGIDYFTYKTNAQKQIAALTAENTTLKNQPPKEVEVIKEVIREVPVEVEKIVTVTKEVPMGFDELSLGDLLSQAFKKLFKIK